MENIEISLKKSKEILEKLLDNNRMFRFRTEFLALHKYDQAQIFNQFNEKYRKKIYQYLSPSELANIFDVFEAQDEKIEGYFKEMLHPYAANVLAQMYADNAVDVLNEISDRDQINLYLHLMPAQAAREISQLINYLDDTAGAMMTTEFIAVDESLTLKEAYYQVRLQAHGAETIYYIYVVDPDKRLRGVVSLRELIVNEEDKLLTDIMNQRVAFVQVNDAQDEVAKMVMDYNLLALPVVGFDQELLGIVTVDDVLDLVQEGGENNYLGLAGLDVSKDQTSPWSACRSRLPWLLTLLFLAMGTSTLISQYSTLVEEVTILSAFITLITGTAGNAGTQSLAKTVWRLSYQEVEESLGKSLLFELLTGALTGLMVAICVFIIIMVWKAKLFLGLMLGIAIFTAILVANLVGLLLPYLMKGLGFDPALASGPFVSTLVDLTSVFIYFTIAGLFLSYLQ